MNGLQLHRKLTQHLARLGLEDNKPQGVNLALLCQALAVSPNCHYPVTAKTLFNGYAASRRTVSVSPIVMNRGFAIRLPIGWVVKSVWS